MESVRSNHQQYMGFSRDHKRPSRLATENNILRSPNATVVKKLEGFYYDDVLMDVHLMRAEIGNTQLPAEDHFAIAVDARQSFALVFYPAGNLSAAQIAVKFRGLRGDNHNISSLERATGMIVNMVPKSQFSSAF